MGFEKGCNLALADVVMPVAVEKAVGDDGCPGGDRFPDFGEVRIYPPGPIALGRYPDGILGIIIACVGEIWADREAICVGGAPE